MYSVVLLAALATAPEAPSFCHSRCWSSCGCYGWSGCYSCSGCHGWSGCHGCHGWGSRWWGTCHGCHGCYSSWGGYGGCGGCYATCFHGWSHGCYGYTGHGCYGTGCHTICHGCAAGGVVHYGAVIDHSISMPVVGSAEAIHAPMAPVAPAAPAAGEKPAGDKPAGDKPANPPKKEGGDSAALPRARVIVHLPTDARLTIDDQVMKTRSAVRTFQTPVLEAGQAYYYIVKAEVVRDGKPLVESKRVVIRAGEEAEVRFTEASLAAAAAKGEAVAQR